VTAASIGDRIRGRDREGGFTLTEVLVALVILGVAVVSIVGAMGTSIVLSDRHRQSVTADALVRTYAERLNIVHYVACTDMGPNGMPADGSAPSLYLASSMGIASPGFTITIVNQPALNSAIGFWKGDGSASTPPSYVDLATCKANGDKGLQQITIRAQASGNRGSQQLTVLKRQP
jgi:prepilin-type N-terminal cleavage/methylation domain-containing protein